MRGSPLPTAARFARWPARAFRYDAGVIRTRIALVVASSLALLSLLSADVLGQSQQSPPASRPSRSTQSQHRQSPAAGLYLDYFTKPSQGWRDLAVEELGKLPPLRKDQAASAVVDLWAAYKRSAEAQLRIAAAKANVVVGRDDEQLHYTIKPTGPLGENGMSAVFIDLHGGGGTHPSVNDRDWRVHQDRYTVPGKIVAVRAPRDTWDHFHNEYFHALMDRLVEQMILAENVDPNRVFIQGYSSGGYGVIQLAPAMPDRFASAACNAAATEGSRPENLRNLPFWYGMGENDTAYDRANLAKQYAGEINALHEKDRDGYTFNFHWLPGVGHGFDDRPAGEWMAKYTRDPYPKRIVWWQNQPGRGSSNPVRHEMYWLAVDPELKRDDSGTKKILATRDGQSIDLTVEGYDKVRVRLNDVMLDLDRPITITVNGTKVIDGVTVQRSSATMLRTFLEKKDPTYAFPVEVTLDVPQPATRGASSTPTTLPSADCCVDGMAAAKLAAFMPPTTGPTTMPSAIDAALKYSTDTAPPFDVGRVDPTLLANNARLAVEARERSPWGKDIDDAMFNNYVLPYANFDEQRDDWRPRLYEQLREKAWQFERPLDAAKWINDNFVELFDVRYHATKRPKPDMSPFESFDAKYASCTGLSILLADACRSVGIPARIVGVAKWTQLDGNHNWVEVWDGQWYSFADAGSDPRGDDWVKDRCRTQTDPDQWQHSVWALSWRDTNAYFPVVWNANQKSLPALNVTRFYSHKLDYKLDLPTDADATVTVYWNGESIVKKAGRGTVSLPLATGSTFRIVITYADGKTESRELRT